MLQAIKNFDGYPRLKDLGRMAPSLTPLKLNVIVRYLERSGAIIIDTEGYIVWTRQKEQEEQLTLGKVAEMSNELRKYLDNHPE